MSVQHEVQFLAYFDESITVRELKRATLLQVTIVELYATTTIGVTLCAIVIHIMPLQRCSTRTEDLDSSLIFWDLDLRTVDLDL